MPVAILLLLAMLAALAPALRAGAEPLAPAGAGWASVGLLTAGAQRCTGALVADDLVLTAAHCLHDEHGAPVPAGAIRFLAGWSNGRAVAVEQASEVLSSPAYRPFAAPDAASAAGDVALVRLARPIRHARVAPLTIGAPPNAGARLAVVSYAEGRSGAPMMERACLVLGRQGGAIVTDCAGAPGASGSPMLGLDGAAPRVVSLLVGGGEMDGRPVALGADLGATLGPLLARARAAPAPPRAPTRTIAGARFVRPDT